MVSFPQCCVSKHLTAFVGTFIWRSKWPRCHSAYKTEARSTWLCWMYYSQIWCLSLLKVFSILLSLNSNSVWLLSSICASLTIIIIFEFLLLFLMGGTGVVEKIQSSSGGGRSPANVHPSLLGGRCPVKSCVFAACCQCMNNLSWWKYSHLPQIVSLSISWLLEVRRVTRIENCGEFTKGESNLPQLGNAEVGNLEEFGSN